MTAFLAVSIDSEPSPGVGSFIFLIAWILTQSTVWICGRHRTETPPWSSLALVFVATTAMGYASYAAPAIGLWAVPAGLSVGALLCHIITRLLYDDLLLWQIALFSLTPPVYVIVASVVAQLVLAAF